MVVFERGLGKIKAKFRQNWGKFGQKWLDLGKIKIFYPQEHSISYGYDIVS